MLLKSVAVMGAGINAIVLLRAVAGADFDVDADFDSGADFGTIASEQSMGLNETILLVRQAWVM